MEEKFNEVKNAKAFGPDQIILRNISKQFSIEGRPDMVHALKNINLSPDSEIYPIRQGEFVMIRGPSGGGKTTMLNLIGTLDAPTTGTVEIMGQIVDKDTPDPVLAELRLKHIGFVFQTFNLIATMSAFENVELPQIINQVSEDERRERSIQLLERVGLLDRLGHLPSELSGGEQQRVAIARALANRPDILLLDEATGDLDTKNTVDVMDLLLRINQEQKITCIMVTHNPDLECYADRILYVLDGRFEKQVLNRAQTRIDYESYMKYLDTL